MNTHNLLIKHLVMLSHIQDGVIKLFANGDEYYRLYCNDDARPYHISEIASAISQMQHNVTVYIINPESKPYCGY